MRRLGMMVVALMMVATMSFAQKVSDSKSMSFDKLSRYLQLDANQIAEVSEINTYFENQLGQPLSAEALCNTLSDDLEYLSNTLPEILPCKPSYYVVQRVQESIDCIPDKKRDR